MYHGIALLEYICVCDRGTVSSLELRRDIFIRDIFIAGVFRSNVWEPIAKETCLVH